MTLPCSVNGAPPGGTNLEVNDHGSDNKFKLETLASVSCSFANGVWTITGTGTGSWGHGSDTDAATIAFRFTDAGEPGKSDVADYRITVGATVVLDVDGTLNVGNQQFHPAV